MLTQVLCRMQKIVPIVVNLNITKKKEVKIVWKSNVPSLNLEFCYRCSFRIGAAQTAWCRSVGRASSRDYSLWWNSRSSSASWPQRVSQTDNDAHAQNQQTYDYFIFFHLYKFGHHFAVFFFFLTLTLALTLAPNLTLTLTLALALALTLNSKKLMVLILNTCTCI